MVDVLEYRSDSLTWVNFEHPLRHIQAGGREERSPSGAEDKPKGLTVVSQASENGGGAPDGRAGRGDAWW